MESKQYNNERTSVSHQLLLKWYLYFYSDGFGIK